MDITQKQFKMEVLLEHPLFIKINWGSFFSGMLAIMVIITFVIHKPKKVSRLSLQMQSLIVFLSVIRQVLLIMESQKKLPDACMGFGFYRYFVDHLYIFLNVSIALNLDLVYIRSFRSSSIFRLKLWLVPLCLSFSVNLIAYFSNAFGLNSLGNCSLKDSTIKDLCFSVLLNYILIIPGILYCLYISFRVGLGKPNKELSAQLITINVEENPISDERIFRELSSLARRISLYPFLCFASFLGMVVFRLTYDITGTRFISLEKWSYLGLTCTGFLNLLSLLLDPSFQHLIGRNEDFGTFTTTVDTASTFKSIHTDSLSQPHILEDTDLIPSSSSKGPKAKWASEYCRLLITKQL